MKVPPNQSEEQIVNNSVDGNNADSDDGLNDGPHSPSREGDFSEYMWMENEEEFEEQIMLQLEEEALVQQCIDDVCAEMDLYIASLNDETANGNATHNGSAADALTQELQNLTVDDNAAQSSKLNPDAAEFVPRFGSSSSSVTKKEDEL
ncbi:polyadenylate-binding protein-interacting protein 2-like [Daphnia pulex]|uniref:polyadenylate-binding protein-interacting protein 2-like n=1 Tax=Daphnia pulex TaxID=6669 RepID=UPI001EDF5286|nr:polyadenylate-binding protein-interacting protein 2-like [Daphnia pulex]XP_046648638.1 polyadenylate-binding protein-interacting protein 2-like [Daphnia pulicaria]